MTKIRDHSKFHYSVTCHTDDFAVAHCLRALSFWAEKRGYKTIPSGGSTGLKWMASHQFKLHFTDKEYGKNFIDKANELLRDRWSPDSQSGDDPQTPARTR